MELVSGVFSATAAVDKCRKGAIKQGTVLHSHSFSSVRSSFTVVWKALLFCPENKRSPKRDLAMKTTPNTRVNSERGETLQLLPVRDTWTTALSVAVNRDTGNKISAVSHVTVGCTQALQASFRLRLHQPLW